MLPGLQALRDRFDAVLVDLDGTLLDRRAELPDRTVRAVHALRAAGLEVLLCTGRSTMGTRRFHERLELPGPHISYNGAWIGRPGEPPWRCSPIPDHLVPHVESTERHAHFSFRHHGEKKYTLRGSHAQQERVAQWYEHVVSVTDPAHLPRQGLMRVSLYYDGTESPETAWRTLPAEIQAVLHREQFPLSIFHEFPDSTLVLQEVQAKGRGKAEAFEWLRIERGIPPSRVVAVGDQTNDLSMLAIAGLAVAMGNAVPLVLEEADVVIGHHAEDGFAIWVESGAPHPVQDA